MPPLRAILSSRRTGRTGKTPPAPARNCRIWPRRPWGTRCCGACGKTGTAVASRRRGHLPCRN